VVCVLRRVVAANASLFFTIHHCPAQLTVLRFADFPDTLLGMIERSPWLLTLCSAMVWSMRRLSLVWTGSAGGRPKRTKGSAGGASPRPILSMGVGRQFARAIPACARARV